MSAATDVTPPHIEFEVAEEPPPTNGRHVDVPVAEHRRESFPARELCHLSGLTATQLAELESYGLLSGKGSGEATMYTAADLAIAEAASGSCSTVSRVGIARLAPSGERGRRCSSR